MLRTSCLQLKSDLDLVDVQLRLGPFVDDVEDVGVQGRQLCKQLRQRTGPVGDPDPEVEVTTTGRQAVTDDAEHQQRIDVPTGQHHDDRWLERRRVRQNRCDTGSACGLHDQLRALEQHDQRPVRRPAAPPVA